MIAVTVLDMSPAFPQSGRSASKRCDKTICKLSLQLIACMKFLLKNYSCDLYNLIGTVGKVKFIQTFTAVVCEC